MQLSILGWLASRCARDANQRGMAECEKRIKTWRSRVEWRAVVHGTTTNAEWQSARNERKHGALHSGLVGVPLCNSAAKRFLEKLQEKKESHGAVPLGGTTKQEKTIFRKNGALILAEARWCDGFHRE